MIAGDIDFEKTRALVEHWFSDVPPGKPVPPPAAPPAMLTEVTRKTMTDRVQLARLYLAWLTPGAYRPGDAALDVVSSLLSSGKNSRLYKRLVYELQIAQDVQAFQQSQALGSNFMIVATARPGKTVEELQKVIDEEIARLGATPPEPRELERALNQIEASFLRQAERVGGFAGKANQLNAYYTQTGTPDFFAEDLARYRSLDATDISSAVRNFLPHDRRVELVVLPEAEAMSACQSRVSHRHWGVLLGAALAAAVAAGGAQAPDRSKPPRPARPRHSRCRRCRSSRWPTACACG